MGIIANGLALLLVAIFYWPPNFIGLHPEGKTRRQQFQDLDFIGLLFYGGGLIIFLLGISWGNNPYPWKSAHVLVPLLLGRKSILSYLQRSECSPGGSANVSCCIPTLGGLWAPQRFKAMPTRDIRQFQNLHLAASRVFRVWVIGRCNSGHI